MRATHYLMIAAATFSALFAGGCQSQVAPSLQKDTASCCDDSAAICKTPAAGQKEWEKALAERLPLYGHRNWIVIADSAYPAQARPGIETIDTGADQIEVVRATLEAFAKTKHVKPIVYTDAELPAVPEKDAPGVTAYRKQLAEVLGNRSVQSIPHEQVIAKLDKAGETFRILILKTNLTVPYTSVFFQLDCAYWNADAEQRLRASLAPTTAPQ